MRLIIVRHGETDRNLHGLYTGPVDVSLNQTGRQQAERLAERLAQEPINIIYSSDLSRAQETAQVIAAYHANVPLILDPKIRERNSGEFSGRPEVEREAARLAAGKSFRNWRPASGESIDDMQRRAGRWFQQCREKHEAQTVVAVTHGLFIHTLLECALDEGAEVEHEKYHHHNTGVTILDVPEAGSTKIIHLNDISHLQ